MKPLLLFLLLPGVLLAQRTIYNDAPDIWTSAVHFGADTSASRAVPTRTANVSKTMQWVGLRYSQVAPDLVLASAVDDGSSVVLSLGSSAATYGPNEIRLGVAASYGGTPVTQFTVYGSGSVEIGSGGNTASGGTRLFRAESKVGSDLAGAGLRIDAGAPTGNADGGNISFYTALDGGTSGSTPRSTSIAAAITKNHLLGIYPWTSAAWVAVGGTLDATTVGVNSSGSTETDLATKTVPGGLVGNSGERLVMRAFGGFAGNTNGKRLRVYVGGTAVLDTGSLVFNDGVWDLECRVYRSSSTTAKVVTVLRTSNAVLPGWIQKSTSLSLTWASDQIVKVTGQGTSTADLVCDAAEWNYHAK